MVYCENCGYKIEKNALFCENCGQKTIYSYSKKNEELKKKEEAEEELKKKQRIEKENELKKHKQQEEKEKKLHLRKERRKAFFNKIKQPKILVPLITIFLVILVIFLPIRVESYTVTVPYEKQEAYQVTEPYQETEYYYDKLSYTITNKDECTWSGLLVDIYAKYGIYIVNTDTLGGNFQVSFKFNVQNGRTLGHTISHYLTSGEGAWFIDEDYDLNFGEKFTCDYTIISPQVQKSRVVTKYRTITRYKTITDYRQETRYKKVNWLFGYNQNFGILIPN